MARAIFMLRKLRPFVNTDVLKLLCILPIFSHLSYGIIVWGHSTSLGRLLVLQKRAMREMLNVSCRTHCKPLFGELRILTVISLYILNCLMYIKSNLRNFPTNNSVHEHYTRQHTLLRAQQCNFKTTINSFCEFGKKMYNLLPNNIKDLDLKCFKKNTVSMLYGVSLLCSGVSRSFDFPEKIRLFVLFVNILYLTLLYMYICLQQ